MNQWEEPLESGESPALWHLLLLPAGASQSSFLHPNRRTLKCPVEGVFLRVIALWLFVYPHLLHNSQSEDSDGETL